MLQLLIIGEASKIIKPLYRYSKAVFLYLNMSKRIFYPLLLLFIPFIGMMITNKIIWNLFDFIIMGFLLTSLSIGINYVINCTKKLKNQILYIGILLLIFLLIWVELSVGIFYTPIAGY